MILVTGGTGLLGSHLLFNLLKSGRKVRAIKRVTSDTGMVLKVFSYYSDNPEELFNKIEWVNADLLDSGTMEDAVQGIDEIYHAGAVVSFYPGDHKSMLKVNIEGTAGLVNLALEQKVGKFCYVSSVATMGLAENGSASTEETYWVPSRRNSVYSISKYGAEREIWRGIEEGLNAVIVNPSFILGPGFWHDNSGLFRLVWEGLNYYTPAINVYVDVRDVTKAMMELMEGNHFGQRYICSAGGLTYLDFFTLIATYLGKPAPSVKVSPWMMSAAWRIEAVRSFLTRSKPELTREMAATTTQNYFFSNEKLCKTLDFTFRPLEDSIREFCGFFLKDHGIRPTEITVK